MPRLTNAEFLKRHHILRHNWLNNQSIYARLSPRHQWELHAYYQPDKELTDEQLLEHRIKITKEQSSLPARAGKHYDHLASSQGSEQDRRAKPAKPGERQIRVWSVVRPEPDLRVFAKALVGLAADLAEKEKQHGKATTDEHP